MIHIYTDGSYNGNTNLILTAGYAVYIPQHNYEFAESILEKTNISRLELLAVKKALEYILKNPDNYIIHCDNEAIVKCFLGKCTRKLNTDIWDEVYKIITQIRSNDKCKFRIDFLDRRALDQSGIVFKCAQTVDRLAYQAANNLCCL